MLLVHIIYFTYNATLVKSVYTSYVQVLTNILHVTTRLKRDITWGEVHSTIIFKFVC